MDGWTVIPLFAATCNIGCFFSPYQNSTVLPPHLRLLGRIQWCILWQHKRDTTLKLSRLLCSVIGLMHRQHYVCIHCIHQHNRCNSTRNSKIHNDLMSSIFTIYLRTQESKHTHTRTDSKWDSQLWVKFSAEMIHPWLCFSVNFSVQSTTFCTASGWQWNCSAHSCVLSGYGSVKNMVRPKSSL